MTNTEIEKAIIETLRELETGCGEPEQQITPKTTPLVDLGFFDSLLAIETTLVLEERFKCSCSDDSVFVDKVTTKPLSVAQIAARLLQLVGETA